MNRQIALLLAAVCLAAVAYRWGDKTRRQQNQGCLNPTEVLNRAERLCKSFVPNEGALRMTSAFVRLPTSDGRVMGRWSVDCINAAHQEVAYFAWDAGTGKLVQASRISREAPRDSQAGWTDDEWTDLRARDAIRSLAGEDVSRTWRLVSRPSPRVSRWRCGGYEAIVHAGTGAGSLAVRFVPREFSVRPGSPVDSI